MLNIKTLFGAKIKEYRKKRGYTQAKLAELVNVDDKHISCIESGKNFPSPDLIERFANALNIEVKDFFEYTHHETPENLKKITCNMISELSDNELVLAYKYIRTFLLK